MTVHDVRKFGALLCSVIVLCLAPIVSRAQTIPSPGETVSQQPAAPQTLRQTADAPRSDATAPGVQCRCTAAKDDVRWTGKDWAALLTGLGGLLGVGVAALAIWSNGRSSRATTIQKANEKELEALQSKLDDFYGPYLQLSSTNRLITNDFKSRRPSPEHIRILLLLLDPAWKQSFKPGDKALIEEILAIDAKLLDLIQDKSGLTSSAIQEYLWRAASHFRIIKLAFDGKLDNDPQRYVGFVYPKQLDEILGLEIARIRDRMNLIRGAPMQLHAPAPDLVIPDRLKLADWPAPSS